MPVYVYLFLYYFFFLFYFILIHFLSEGHTLLSGIPYGL